MSLKVGNWVRSYGAGIWQIYRIEDVKCLDPVTRKETMRTVIFSKRFVSSSYRRSFKEACCHPVYVSLLTPEELDKLEQFIGENQSLYSKFVAYTPKPISSIYNARIGRQDHMSLEEAEKLIPSHAPLNQMQISRFLEELGFAPGKLPSWTAQFVSDNHHCENGYLVYKFSRFLGC